MKELINSLINYPGHPNRAYSSEGIVEGTLRKRQENLLKPVKAGGKPLQRKCAKNMRGHGGRIENCAEAS